MTTFLGDSNADLHMDTSRSTTLKYTHKVVTILQRLPRALPWETTYYSINLAYCYHDANFLSNTLLCLGFYCFMCRKIYIQVDARILSVVLEYFLITLYMHVQT